MKEKQEERTFINKGAEKLGGIFGVGVWYPWTEKNMSNEMATYHFLEPQRRKREVFGGLR